MTCGILKPFIVNIKSINIPWMIYLSFSVNSFFPLSSMIFFSKGSEILGYRPSSSPWQSTTLRRQLACYHMHISGNGYTPFGFWFRVHKWHCADTNSFWWWCPLYMMAVISCFPLRDTSMITLCPAGVTYLSRPLLYPNNCPRLRSATESCWTDESTSNCDCDMDPGLGSWRNNFVYSLNLFAVTRPRQTEIEYPPPPLSSEMRKITEK